MITRILPAALALVAASSLDAQAVAPDLTYATPLGGEWHYAATSGGSEAVFRDGSARPQLTIRCARARRAVTIAKPASAAAPFLFVWTSSSSKSYPATFDAAGGQLSVTVAATDNILDAMAFSRGRLGISVTGSPPLVVPPWEEVARVIEDCRA
ncbi:MAG TPA: hypothetical protein VFP57_05515 [Sphingomicrobium sp.]|nr:hypothetical protein [Sphingomicrobium sp.]